MNNRGVAQALNGGAHRPDGRQCGSGVIARDKHRTAEQRLDKPEVGGSNPSPSTICKWCIAPSRCVEDCEYWSGHSAGTEAKMKITDLVPDKQRYEGFAERQPHGDRGMVVIRECYLCGDMQWVSTDTSQLKGYCFDELPNYDRPCRVCQEVQFRNPEVFNWVMNCMASMMRELSRHVPSAEGQR